jgi:hypothetical protein
MRGGQVGRGGADEGINVVENDGTLPFLGLALGFREMKKRDGVSP